MTAATVATARPTDASWSEAAPAKVNLALHVTGRRADGYHLLDTLVVPAAVGDRLTALHLGDRPVPPDRPANVTLAVEGPCAGGLDAGPDNLVIRAARRLETEARCRGAAVFDVALVLDKRLPVASGVGGGSSDAAAPLRLLDRLWGLGLGRDRLAEIGLSLGADVPMCVHGRPLRAGGIGEAIAFVDGLPAFALVLVNPGVPVSTPAVFRALETRDNPPLPDLPDRFADLDAFVDWLATTRNDLEPAAIAVAPAIGDVLGWLRSRPGCRLARMSGSGATCFGVFADAATADVATTPEGWWSAAPQTA